MTGNASGSLRVLGSLRSADGAGVVRIEEHFAAGIDDLWAALTQGKRLARWYGAVEGELGAGGEFRARVYASGWEGTGRVDECDPPLRFRVVSRAAGEPNEDILEVTLNGVGDQTTLVVEQQGLPLDLLWAYAAGLQIHIEDLAAFIAGRERSDSKMRFDELKPAYQELAASIA
jgi:uncharacterized protein YndB with AHSA1/START domain